MKILVIGGGGREHAIVWALNRSKHKPELHCTPGNAGISGLAKCHDIKAEDIQGIVCLAHVIKPDLIVVGPEVPLTLGIVDLLPEFRVFGPSQRAAQLEGSKIFAKEFMIRNAIPTADFCACNTLPEAVNAIDRFAGQCVIKADGLAAGKGVIVCSNVADACLAARSMLVDDRFGKAGARIIVEQRLSGEEASIMAICDGDNWQLLDTSQDHKAIGENDTGENTGGMGSYSPAPVITAALKNDIEETVIRKSVEGMRREGMPFTGVLYAGIMIVDGAPKVLEYNVRFGDPETQSVLIRLKSDLCELIYAAVDGTLASFASLEWDARPAVCVVAVSGGYPGRYQTGYVIEDQVLEDVSENTVVFHSGTRWGLHHELETSGGRVLSVTSLGDSFQDARDKAYSRLKRIRFEKEYHRTDIAWRALRRDEEK